MSAGGSHLLVAELFHLADDDGLFRSIHLLGALKGTCEGVAE